MARKKDIDNNRIITKRCNPERVAPLFFIKNSKFSAAFGDDDDVLYYQSIIELNL